MATPSSRYRNLILEAQGSATILLEFEPYIPTASTVKSLAYELRAISGILEDLYRASTDPRNSRDNRFYSESICAVLQALERTLEDLDRLTRRRDRATSKSKHEAYLTAWIELDTFFYNQNRRTLSDRLGCFKWFLQELVYALKGEYLSREFDERESEINDLALIQKKYLQREIENLELRRDATAGPAKSKSWERKRPEAKDRPPPAPVAPDPTSGKHRPRPASPITPPGPGRLRGTRPEPIPPMSPPSSTFTGTSSSGSPPRSVGSEMASHWSLKAFSQPRPNTVFNTTSTESALFGSHNSGAKNYLHSKNYAELLELPFDNEIKVKIYVREVDRNAQIYCRAGSNGERLVSRRSITKVFVHREDSNLQFYEFDEKKKRKMWLILRFTSYERMVLFFCAFLALKRDDNLFTTSQLDNHVLPGEKHIFSCTIYDNHFRHALQIYKDEKSGGIRLQASILSGEKKRAPVWTAFINYKIAAFKWIKRVEPHKIHLTDLPRYVFSNDYTPHMGPNGEYELHFDNEADAGEFERKIEDLAEHKI